MHECFLSLFNFFFKLLAGLDFCCFAVAFSYCSEWGLLSISGFGILIVVGFSLWCSGFSLWCSGLSCGVFSCEAQALCARASVVEAQGLSSSCPRPQSTQASVVVACGFGSCGSQCLVGAHRLSCSTPCDIFLKQGSNLCPLHWQVDYYPPYHEKSPAAGFKGFIYFKIFF